MSRPSEKALGIAEELLDYVHPGMSRAAAVEEIASMIDDMNTELLEVVTAILERSQGQFGGHPVGWADHLRELLTAYQPWRPDPHAQHELFTSETVTSTHAAPIAGQMP